MYVYIASSGRSQRSRCTMAPTNEYAYIYIYIYICSYSTIQLIHEEIHKQIIYIYVYIYICIYR